MRRKLVVGNWKMHGSRQQVDELLQGLLLGLDAETSAVEIAVCPTHIHLGQALQILAASTVSVGAQNLHSEPEGAYTGEVSAVMLADLGVSLALVGHSERRQIFHESDVQVAAKFMAAQGSKMTPILCVGETLEQRQQGITGQVVLAQLDAVIEAAGISAFAEAVVAYEPVWAIGTGQTASPAQAQEVHRLIREHLAKQDSEIAESIRILYGGSVKGSNAGELFAEADIDGGLVGGASLKAEEFISICKSAD